MTDVVLAPLRSLYLNFKWWLPTHTAKYKPLFLLTSSIDPVQVLSINVQSSSHLDDIIRPCSRRYSSRTSLSFRVLTALVHRLLTTLQLLWTDVSYLFVLAFGVIKNFRIFIPEPIILPALLTIQNGNAIMITIVFPWKNSLTRSSTAIIPLN